MVRDVVPQLASLCRKRRSAEGLCASDNISPNVLCANDTLLHTESDPEICSLLSTSHDLCAEDDLCSKDNLCSENNLCPEAAMVLLPPEEDLLRTESDLLCAELGHSGPRAEGCRAKGLRAKR